MKISANTLKLIALAAMTIDHTALMFIPANWPAYFIMRFLGRMTAPILTYLLVEGFHNTRSHRKYLGRLLMFALISQPFYHLMVFGQISIGTGFLAGLNVMYTLAVSLVMLSITDNGKINVYAKALLIGVCFMLSEFGDWMHYIPMWALIFHKFRQNFKKQAVVFCVVSAVMVTYSVMTVGVDISFQYGVLAAIIPICLYNGERSGKIQNKAFNAVGKWAAYIYYPFHIAVLTALKY